MTVDNFSLTAVRVLLAVRESSSGSLDGIDVTRIIDSNPEESNRTGWQMIDPRRLLKLLVGTGMLDATHIANGVEQPFDSARFGEVIAIDGEYGLDTFKFSIADTLSDIQNALGLHSLTELERRATGNTINIQPLFGQVEPKFTLNYNDSVFVAMPFKEDMLPVFEDCIDPVVRKFGKRPVRADKVFTERSIMSDVWHAIYSAFAVIIDCSGRNANVFYELGMAHTVGKKCIILAQSKDDIPFDITQFRYITYSNDREGLDVLQRSLANALMSFVREDKGI